MHKTKTCKYKLQSDLVVNRQATKHAGSAAEVNIVVTLKYLGSTLFSLVAVERARVRLKWSFKVLSHFGSRATL